jgi:uridine kinase
MRPLGGRSRDSWRRAGEQEAVEAVVRLLVARRGRPVGIVAVDGHSAAGKSTFAALLATELAATIVHADNFYRVMGDRRRATLTAAEGASEYYDWQRLRDEALVPLRSGSSARFHPYDWERNALALATVSVSPSPVVIVEGLFVSRPELRHFVDVAVLVTEDAETRATRQRHRADATDDWLRRWDDAERWYFENVRPPSSFDVIVGATDP